MTKYILDKNISSFLHKTDRLYIRLTSTLMVIIKLKFSKLSLPVYYVYVTQSNNVTDISMVTVPQSTRTCMSGALTWSLSRSCMASICACRFSLLAVIFLSSFSCVSFEKLSLPDRAFCLTSWALTLSLASCSRRTPSSD